MNSHSTPVPPKDTDRIVQRLFDKVYVINMPESKDRRAYITDHLAKVGIVDFEFHDACGPDHPDVEAFQASDRVMSYPPCFRCGKNSCGKDDCNNVLIPPQIATFITYLRLWEKISAEPQRALVIEDDVFFHPHWLDVLHKVAEKTESGALTFQSDIALLLRFGWALNEEHNSKRPFEMSTVVKMSNPCHALTSKFAQLLLERFKRVETTPDVFMHRDCPEPGEAITIFPPIASELSWSVGQFQSLIHPKKIRADYLEESGDRGAAKGQNALVEKHHMHMFHRKLLIVGHPRAGTGYTASLLKQIGLDVGHERDGNDGISSWMFTVEDGDNPYALSPIAKSRKALSWDYLIHPVRDITTAAASIIRENRHAPPSYEFRRKHILAEFGIDLDGLATELECALVSLLYWTKLIERMRPDIRFRIEDQSSVLLDFAREKIDSTVNVGVELDLSPVNANKFYRGKTYPKPEINAEDWCSLPAEIKSAVKAYCETYGYLAPEMACSG